MTTVATTRLLGTSILALALAASACGPAPLEPLTLGDEFEALGEELGPHQLPVRIRHGRSGLVLVLISPGEYVRGTAHTEAERDSDETIFEVEVEQAFYIGETEVTVEAWTRIVGDPPGDPQEDPGLPIWSVSWYKAKEFLEAMNAEGEGGWRLPTENEWEYCCRAGTTTPFSFGENISTDQVNYDGEVPYDGAPRGLRRDGPVPVRSMPANAWGLYEMHGNLFEWCEDPYVFNVDPEAPPPAAKKGQSRVIRGGAFTGGANLARSGYRDGYPPNSAGEKYSLRVVKSLPR